MIAAALPFAKKYWLEIGCATVIALLSATVYIQHIQKQNISLSFENFKLASIDIVRQREAENADKASKAESARKERELTYAQKLESMQADIRAYQAKNSSLSSDNSRLASVNDGLRNAADSSRRALSEMVESARASAGSGHDSDTQLTEANKYIEILTLACKQTDSDYKALRNWADDQCSIYGCE